MKCLICKNPILPEEEIKTCEKCKYDFHLECWNENGGCGTPGCLKLPKKVKEHVQEFEGTTYWGATTKPCPACGETINVDELVCPFCKERFETIAPISAEDMKRSYTRRQPEVKEKKGAIIIFICSLIGITAPFNLLFGGIWYKQKRKILKEASPMHNLLAIVGLLISVVYSVLILLGILLFSKNNMTDIQLPQAPAPAPAPVPSGEPKVIVPGNVKGKWGGVKLVVENKATREMQEYTVKLNSDLKIPNSNIKVSVGEFLPDFRMDVGTITSASNEPNNPTVYVKIYDNNKEAFKGWLYSKFPAIHPFEHPKYNILLKEGMLN